MAFDVPCAYRQTPVPPDELVTLQPGEIVFHAGRDEAVRVVGNPQPEATIPGIDVTCYTYEEPWFAFGRLLHRVCHPEIAMPEGL